MLTVLTLSSKMTHRVVNSFGIQVSMMLNRLELGMQWFILDGTGMILPKSTGGHSVMGYQLRNYNIGGPSPLWVIAFPRQIFLGSTEKPTEQVSMSAKVQASKQCSLHCSCCQAAAFWHDSFPPLGRFAQFFLPQQQKENKDARELGNWGGTEQRKSVFSF